VAAPVTALLLADAETVADLGTLVSRARAADPDGAIRLHAHERTLAAYVGVLPGAGLLGEGAVIGLRTMPLAVPSDVDATVPLAAVSDRLARDLGGTGIPVPPATVRVPWAAVAPPRHGWERVGAVTAEELAEVAREGIAEIAQGTPGDAGGHAVAALRRRVWGQPTRTAPPFPAGAAFAAHVLGFAPPGTEVTVYAHGRWTRLTGAGGHVLAR
jgi:hypothetical protein